MYICTPSVLFVRCSCRFLRCTVLWVQITHGTTFSVIHIFVLSQGITCVLFMHVSMYITNALSFKKIFLFELFLHYQKLCSPHLLFLSLRNIFYAFFCYFWATILAFLKLTFYYIKNSVLDLLNYLLKRKI